MAALATCAVAVLLAALQLEPGGPAVAPVQDATQPAPRPPPLTTPATPPVEPSAEAATYALRDGPQCGDFRAGPDGTWTALASIGFPGPQGPVRIAAGQVVAPGGYLAGLDLAAILQARCF